jgi:hypothetical protein
MVKCAWINCKYNSFVINDEMRKLVYKGEEIAGTGNCKCEKDISLSLEEEKEESLICDNYIEGNKL